MRKLLLLVLLITVAAIAFYRQRLFLRDPLGKVMVSGVAVPGASVFINYSNDVLARFPDDRPMVLVQGWDRTPGSPHQLVCLMNVACLTPNDHAPKVPIGHQATASMSDRMVSYRNEQGETVGIVIR